MSLASTKNASPTVDPPGEDKLFRETFENVALGLAHLSPEGRWLRINARLCETLGYTVDEMQALTFQDITHPKDLAADLAEVERLLAGDIQRYSMEKRYRHKQGHWVSAQLTVSLIRTPTGAPDYFISVVEDISARKAMERQLHAHELQNSIMAENIPCGLARLDTNLRFEFANHMYEAGFARPASEIVGQLACELYPPDAFVRVKAYALRVLRGEVVRYQATYPYPDGEMREIDVTMAPQRGTDGKISGLIIVINDITELLRTQHALRESVTLLRHLAQHDTLTGLPNRALFNDTLQQALVTAKRNNTRLALVFTDLDEFKPVNDELGHQAGDAVLQEAARRMRRGVRESDTVARIGGDEFVLLLPTIDSLEDTVKVAVKVQTLIAHTMRIGEHEVHISSSSGVALYPDHGHDADSLMSCADTAMYQAKRTGGNQVVIYTPGMESTADATLNH